MACLAGGGGGPARVLFSTLATAARARPASLAGGGSLRFCFWRLACTEQTSLLSPAATEVTGRRHPETLVSVSAARWLSHHPPYAASEFQRPSVWSFASVSVRPFSTTTTDLLRRTSAVAEKGDDDKEKKPSIFKRFKQMYKDYWYVLVPVHLVTSAVWYGSFYYASKSGIDIAGLLQSWGFSDAITEKLRNSAAGHLAVAYALYKIATPARYAVTLGGTTYSIKFLSERGYIKPVPSRKELKDMYDDRREELRDRIGERRREWREMYQRQRKEWREKYQKQRKEWREKYHEQRKRGWRRK